MYPFLQARMWAQKFNERAPPKSVDFIAAYVLELVDRAGKPLCGVEKFIPGTYVKWNNNWCVCNAKCVRVRGCVQEA